MARARPRRVTQLGVHVHWRPMRDRRPGTTGFAGDEPAGGGLWRGAQRRGLPRQERKTGTPRARRVKAGKAARGVCLDEHTDAHLVVLCVSSKRDRLCDMDLSRSAPDGGLATTIAWMSRHSKCRGRIAPERGVNGRASNAIDACSRCPHGAPWPTPTRRAPWKEVSPCRNSSARAGSRRSREA